MPEGTSAPASGDTIYTRRAEYHDPTNAFAFHWPPVPRRQFLAERDRALNPATGTAEILWNLSLKARWRGGQMMLRWVAAGVLEAAKGFRRLKGHADMPQLVAALRVRDQRLGLGDSMEVDHVG